MVVYESKTIDTTAIQRLRIAIAHQNRTVSTVQRLSQLPLRLPVNGTSCFQASLVCH